MAKPTSRRDFLKLLALTTPSLLAPQLLQAPLFKTAAPGSKNVLVIVFDALSARNIGMYGYPRQTMPNLARIAQRATVFHDHYSGGNFTTPGTSSLLTGTYPWTHRAIGLGRIVTETMKHKSLFAYFADYYRIGYSHNTIVNKLFKEFSSDISYLKAQRDLFLRDPLAFDALFPGDADAAEVAYQRTVNKADFGSAYSLFFSSIYARWEEWRARQYSARYPRGLPSTGEDNYFVLEQGVDWVISQLPKTPQPYLAYFHFLPPHHPYCASAEFVGAFASDTLGSYITKPQSPLNRDQPYSLKVEANERRRYDEFILYADAQLGRLYDELERSGALENTVLVFTSDHGELCERGIIGHHTSVLYQPLIRIPLLVVEPGQQQRRDVFEPTSAVDVLPTLLHLTGHPLPGGLEGQVLPPFAAQPAAPHRSIFAVEAKLSPDPDHKPLYPISLTLVKDGYELTRYAGYEELGSAGEVYELYDLKNDPEELHDLYASKKDVAAALKNEMLESLKKNDRPPLAG